MSGTGSDLTSNQLSDFPTGAGAQRNCRRSRGLNGGRLLGALPYRMCDRRVATRLAGGLAFDQIRPQFVGVVVPGAGGTLPRLRGQT